MGKIIKYDHHGKEVFVDEDLKGKHREHCLCHKCNKLDVTDPIKNCKIAQTNFLICCEYNITTPVYECSAFEEKKSNAANESN